MVKATKDPNLGIFERDLKIVELAQTKALKIIKEQDVSVSSLASIIKDSAKRVLDFKKDFEKTGLIVEIIDYQKA